MTLNEPWVSAVVGYLHGRHAPGHTSLEEMLPASHRLLLAHGWSMPVIRQAVPGGGVWLVRKFWLHTAGSPRFADRPAASARAGLLTPLLPAPTTRLGYPCGVVALFPV